jgi:hypothetical protein
MQVPAEPREVSQKKHVRPWHHPIAFAVALVGGVLGIPGAFVTELQAGGFILVPLIAAPIAEEALKPTGVYILLAKWPHMLRGQAYTAILAALGGLAFGLVEAVVYVEIYVSDPPDWFAAYRFTVPIAMHTTASFIWGMGINRGVVDWVQGRGPLPVRSRNLFVTAALLHAVFNLVAIIIAIGSAIN